MTTKPVIICAALTGAVPSKENNPAVPVTVDEIIASAKEAFDAGATIAHVHARGEDGKSSSDINLFRQIKNEYCYHNCCLSLLTKSNICSM